jgi:branched-chain amino acid aminotransferase
MLWLNGSLVDEADARVSPLSAGLLYGWGVFTTLGVRGGRTRAFSHHWARLAAHAEKLRVAIDWDAADVEAGIATIVRAENVIDGRARVTVVRSAAGVWQPAGGPPSDVMVVAASVAPHEAAPLALTVSPYRLLSGSPLAGVKSTAYVGQLLALDEARARGFDEALMLNERGEIAEATTANVFWLRDGELFTPSLATGCLSGVTRRIVLEAARARRTRVVEGGFALSELRSADEVFLTNSTRGVMPVGELDMHKFTGGLATARLAEGLERLLAS